MEFINDFLEREAPAMKQFLQSISVSLQSAIFCATRTEVMTSFLCSQSPLPCGVTAPLAFSVEYDGFIDLGKQLSILHSLLLECITKVAPAKLKDVDRLHVILQRVVLAMTQSHHGLMRPMEISSDVTALHNYHSLQRNVFRYFRIYSKFFKKLLQIYLRFPEKFSYEILVFQHWLNMTNLGGFQRENLWSKRHTYSYVILSKYYSEKKKKVGWTLPGPPKNGTFLLLYRGLEGSPEGIKASFPFYP